MARAEGCPHSCLGSNQERATGGFRPAVSGSVNSFVTTWSEHGQKSAERAAHAAENLGIVDKGYTHDDQTMATIFDSWPIS